LFGGTCDIFNRNKCEKLLLAILSTLHSIGTRIH
jgi:hypothetical protein